MNINIGAMSKKKIAAFAALAVLGLLAAWMSLTRGTSLAAADVEIRDVLRTVPERGFVESDSAVTLVAKGTGTVGDIHFSEGESVARGEAVLSYSDFAPDAEVQSLRAQAQGLQAQYAAAKEESDRNRMLYEEGVISYADYSRSLAVTHQLAAQLQSVNHMIAGLRDATAAGGVISPQDGVVTALYVRTGQMVQPGMPLAEVGKLDDRVVVLHLMPRDADELSVGSAAVITFHDEIVAEEAYISEIGFQAVDYVSPMGLSQKRVRVVVALPEEGSLRMGSDVEVRIVVGRAEDVPAVPSTAVFQEGDAHFLYRIEGRKALKTPVEVGLEGDGFLEIRQGVSPGDRVVIAPPSELRDGGRVVIK